MHVYAIISDGSDQRRQSYDSWQLAGQADGSEGLGIKG